MQLFRKDKAEFKPNGITGHSALAVRATQRVFMEYLKFMENLSIFLNIAGFMENDDDIMLFLGELQDILNLKCVEVLARLPDAKREEVFKAFGGIKELWDERRPRPPRIDPFLV